MSMELFVLCYSSVQMALAALGPPLALVEGPGLEHTDPVQGEEGTAGRGDMPEAGNQEAAGPVEGG